LYGPKVLDYQDWCIGIKLIIHKQHLTKEGLNKLKNNLLKVWIHLEIIIILSP